MTTKASWYGSCEESLAMLAPSQKAVFWVPWRICRWLDQELGVSGRTGLIGVLVARYGHAYIAVDDVKDVVTMVTPTGCIDYDVSEW